jgi:hypothetical protein
MMKLITAVVAGLGLLLTATTTLAEETTSVGEITINAESAAGMYKEPSYSPYGGRNFPTELLWGDTHLHTNLSLDARTAGVILSPRDAFRFASGKEVTSTHGERVKLSRPLDWVVVTDHSDAIGVMNEIIAGNPQLMTDPTLRDWHSRIIKGGDSALRAGFEVVETFSRGQLPEAALSEKFAKNIWDDYFDAADEYNDPGRFTAMIGYEWTSTPDGNNLHRNVFYRDDADTARQVLPLTVAEGFDPAGLWDWMEAYEAKTGGSVIAAAHNGNLSNGLMFSLRDYQGRRMSRAYAERRQRWEPVYEVTQIKGDGEAHPMLSTSDEFADYGTWDKGNLGSSVKEDSMLQYEYAREALKNGMMMEERLGANPFKFGMIGATDSHTGLATAGEDNFFGKHSLVEPSEHRFEEVAVDFGSGVILGWEMVASGYTAVWATENTRAGVWDAMARREVYATTGSRISVRLFGGFDFVPEDALVRLPANVGYGKGVPMGGDLTRAPEGKSVTFLVGARKDPYSGNLDRIQIVKGWLDDDGDTKEKVYDVAWAGDRAPGPDGNLPAIGNTVDVENATWTNSIGAPELITVWTDPDFDPSDRAFYYARVIEIPTPRWTAYEAKYFGVDMPDEVPMTTQERAYTSPIWYTP